MIGRHVTIAPAELVRSHGGRYATAFGIDLAADSGERFKWFLAAILYGARISEQLATRTWREFAARGVLTPQHVLVKIRLEFTVSQAARQSWHALRPVPR